MGKCAFGEGGGVGVKGVCGHLSHPILHVFAVGSCTGTLACRVARPRCCQECGYRTRACWVLPCCVVFSFYALKPHTETEMCRCFSSFSLGHKALIIPSWHLPFCWCSGAGQFSSSVTVLRRNRQRNALLEGLQNQQNATTSLLFLSG